MRSGVRHRQIRLAVSRLPLLFLVSFRRPLRPLSAVTVAARILWSLMKGSAVLAVDKRKPEVVITSVLLHEEDQQPDIRVVIRTKGTGYEGCIKPTQMSAVHDERNVSPSPRHFSSLLVPSHAPSPITPNPTDNGVLCPAIALNLVLLDVFTRPERQPSRV